MSSKIIIISHEFAPYRGGIATYVEEVATAATQEGYDLEVWTQGKAVDDARYPFSIRRFPGRGDLRPISLISLLAHLYGETETLKRSRVYLPSRASQWVYMNLYRLLGWNPGKEIISTFHGTEILRYSQNSWLRESSNQFFTQSVNRLTTASHYSIKLLNEVGFSSWAERAIVAPCALRSSFIAQTNCDNVNVIPFSDKIKILTLARIHPRKGQKEVVQALSLLPDELKKKIVYQIAGVGDLEYQKQIQKIADEQKIHCQWMGEIPESEIGAVYQGCDFYVMSSRSLPESVEGFGMTYLEAGYFEKPVVGYRTGGVEEAVLDQKTGFLVEEGCISALAQAIQRLIENPDLRLNFGKKGREHALSFSWKKTAHHLFSY